MSRRAFVFALLVVAALVVSLYRAKYGAREAAEQIAAVEAQLAEARERKALLETELSHMSRRAWIAEYARKELGMGPPRPDQFVTPEELDGRLGPVRAPGESSGASVTQPEETGQ